MAFYILISLFEIGNVAIMHPYVLPSLREALWLFSRPFTVVIHLVAKSSFEVVPPGIPYWYHRVHL